MHFMSTKLSSVNLPDVRDMTFFGPFCHIIEVVNACMWWDPHTKDMSGMHVVNLSICLLKLTKLNCFNPWFSKMSCTFESLSLSEG